LNLLIQFIILQILIVAKDPTGYSCKCDIRLLTDIMVL
jgi:hypothetical protein